MQSLPIVVIANEISCAMVTHTHGKVKQHKNILI